MAGVVLYAVRADDRKPPTQPLRIGLSNDHRERSYLTVLRDTEQKLASFSLFIYLFIPPPSPHLFFFFLPHLAACGILVP